MKRLSVVGSLLAMALMAICAATPSASATVLCETATNPCPNYYGRGTTLNAVGPSVLRSAAGEVKCQALVRAARITNAGAKGTNVTGNFNHLEVPSGCGGIQVVKSGTFTISSPNEGNGVITTEGLEFTVETGGLHCIWAGSGSISFAGGENASMKGTIALTRVGGKSGAACGTTAEWTVEMGFGPYNVWGPEHIYAEERPVSTVLCKSNTSPCSGGTYGKGTTIEANLKSEHLVIHYEPYELWCEEAAIKGETSNAGGSEEHVTGTVTALTFGECINTIVVLNNGSFAINAPGEGNGVLTLEGFEITTLTFGTHCIWGGSLSIPLDGGEMASLTGPVELARVGGSSGTLCGYFQKWTLEYTITTPEPLYVEET